MRYLFALLCIVAAVYTAPNVRLKLSEINLFPTVGEIFGPVVLSSSPKFPGTCILHIIIPPYHWKVRYNRFMCHALKQPRSFRFLKWQLYLLLNKLDKRIISALCIILLWARGSEPICRDGPISRWWLQSMY